MFSLRRCNRVGFIALVVVAVLLITALSAPPGRGPPHPPPPPPPPPPLMQPPPPPHHHPSLDSNTNSNLSWLQSWFSRPVRRKCADIAVPADYWALEEAMSHPFVDIQQTGPISLGETVCVRVVVPAPKARVSVLYTPFPGKPWDSVQLDLVGNITGVSVPVRLRAVEDYRNSLRDSAHVYEADVPLRDVDAFVPQGVLEYRDAKWNPEDGLPPVVYAPEALQVSDGLVVQVVDSDQNNRLSLAQHLSLPLCTEANPEGRWLNATEIPFDTSTLMPPDHHGRIWVPYTCRMQRYSYQDFTKCLVQKYPILHMYGDSNTRRMLKKLTTLGEWCSTEESHTTHPCLCEDYGDRFERFRVSREEVVIDMDPITGGNSPTGNFSKAMAPPNKSRIYFRRWGGLTARNAMPWSRSFDAGVQHFFGTPQVAIISLTNWDAAFSTRAYFAAQLDRLVALVEKSYGPETEIILRTGQHYCCRYDNSRTHRQYSRLRNQSFDSYIADVFRERLGDRRRISVWDVATLMETQPLEIRSELPFCPSNHARAEIIDIENHLLFNRLCNPADGAEQRHTTNSILTEDESNE
ncbi:hypothetical protein GGH99_001668 [Coemansia sp. RSA 1285]|nr:hypothetical protein GGH99_001668 [Coemansia sp. RSA 1285]